MTEKTNVGMSFFIADITSMCGVGSDGAAALISACSIARCGSHQCHKVSFSDFIYINMNRNAFTDLSGDSVATW